MRASTAYFAGVGTVVVAIAAGLGGGLTIADILSPTASRPQTTRLEQRMSAQPLPASNQPDEQKAPVPYVAASQAAAITAAPPQNQSQTQAKTQAEGKANTQAQTQAAAPAPRPASRQPAPREQTAVSDDAKANDVTNDANKPRDADLKRQADQRKADRQQQWADRRKHDQQQREQDLRDAQARMQDDDDGPRDVVVRRDWRDNRGSWREDRRDWRESRDDSDRPMRFGFPNFNLFGPDN